MPENLLGKIFSSWFNFINFEHDNEIEDATLTNRETAIIGGLGSFIADFWQKRPTRLFNLLTEYQHSLPQHFFSFLDREIKRLPIALANNYYSKAQLKLLLQLAEKHAETDLTKKLQNYTNKTFHDFCPANSACSPAIPLIITSKDANCPKVIFDHFSTDFTLSMRLPENNRVIRRHRRITEMFIQHNNSSKVTPLLPMMCFPFPGFKIEGDSFELGLWVNLWLASHSWPKIPKICCTGAINVDNGLISEVTFLDLKLEAALAMDYEICLVPAKNVLASKFAFDSRVIPINDVDELNNWLLLNSGNARQIRRVINWLQSDRRLPDLNDFNVFFSEHSLPGADIIAGWKSLISHLAPNTRLRKIKHLTTAFSQNYLENTQKTLAFLPVGFKLALLPWLLKDLATSSPVTAEQMYLDFSRRFTESSPETYLTSRLLLEKSHYSILAQPDFFKARQRFPLLVWLFFREPIEMLLAFSMLTNLSGIEKTSLKLLIKLLNKYAASYLMISGTRRIDARIMQVILRRIDKDAKFRPGPVLTVRKRLLFLWHAMRNFARQNHTHASEICQILLDMHLNAIAEKSGVSIAQLSLRIRANKPEDVEISLQDLQQIPALHDLLQAVKNDTSNTQYSLQTLVSQNPGNRFKNALREKSRNMLWFPQPGIAILRAILSKKWSDFAYFSVLRQFSNDNYQTPASELRQSCLAYYAGLICTANPKIPGAIENSRFYRRAGALRLPFIVGYLWKSAEKKENICETCQKLIKEHKFPVESLFWAILMPADCQKCLKPWLTEQIKNIVTSTRCGELRQKSKLYAAMLHSLIFADETGIAQDFWQASLVDCAANALASRRTTQALAPVYYLLSGHYRQAMRHVKTNRHLVNNSEFALAFLLRFSRYGKVDFRLQPVPEISLSLEKQLLSSLSLGYYYLFRKKLFNDYVVNQVEDLPNLHLLNQLAWRH